MATKVKLVVAEGPTRTRKVEVRKERTLVGRGKGCDVRIPSAEVSRRHCKLLIRDGWLTVEDLGSINGTFLNGKRVIGQKLAKAGDRLKIGPVTFTVEYVPEDVPGEVASVGPEPVSEAEEPVTVAPADEPEVLALAEEAPPAAEEAPAEEAIVLEEDEEEVVLELDESGDWHLPGNEDLNDLLHDLE